MAHRIAGLVLLASLVAASASAQDLEYVPEAGGTGGGGDGIWTLTGTVNASANVSSNRRVIGQIEGTGVTLGVALGGEATYNGGPHEFRTTLNLTESFSRTPVIDQFVKSGDQLNLESIYYFHVPSVDWLGPFARFRMDTSVFRGNDFRPEPTQYLIANVDGTSTALTTDVLLLTESFSPLALKQSIGAFARPLNATWLAIDVRLGAGARETLADGQLVLADAAGTADVIEVLELQSFTQAGGEGTLLLSGATNDTRVTYNASAEVMLPFYDSLTEGAVDAIDLANLEIGAGLSFKLTDWASLDYSLRATRTPSLLDEWQVANLMLLTLGGSWTYTNAPPAPEAPVE